MPGAKVKSKIICGILLICMIAVLKQIVQLVHLTPLSNIISSKSSEEAFNINRKKLSDLRVLEPSHFNSQSDVRCINASHAPLSFPMCIYDPEDDVVVSKVIASGKYYESGLVHKLIIFFRTHPDVSFVDLGANLGTYSLPIAHSGIHVVAVEPNKDTVRRLAKSVHLGGIEKNIDIFQYALSNEESTTFLQFDLENRGDTFMIDNATCPRCLWVNVTVLNKLIPFIRHKKAVIKIDTQEAEIMIFQRKSAAQFFDEIDVVMVQMEWVLYPERYGKTEDERRKVDRFLEFFYQRGYEVYDPRSDKKLDANWTNWPYDVLFKKEDLPKNKLYYLS